MDLYQFLNAQPGNEKVAKVEDIIGANLGLADAESVYSAAAADDRLQHSREAGAVRVNPDAPKPDPVAERKKPTTKRGRVTREVDQNAHAWALLNDRELTPTQVAIGMRIHYYAYAPKSGGRCVKARATLAAHCKVSEETLKRATKVLVERGYFQRVDSGQGGFAGNGKSTYVPVLPEFLA